MTQSVLIFFFSAILFQNPAQAALPLEFKATNLQTGKPVTISTRAADKKGVVFTFLSAKCPCSDSHIPEVKRLSAQFPDFRFVIVHSNADEPLDLAKNYFKNADLPIDVIQDEKAQIADELKAFKTPHVFVFNSTGEVVYKGGMTNSSNAPDADQHFLEAALKEVKEGKKVTISEGRTLGCAIAREKNQNVW
jgi:hypothetical protein